MINSLRFRLGLGSIVAIILSLFAAWWALSEQFTNFVLQSYVKEMSALADSISAGLAFDRNNELKLVNRPSDPRTTLPAGGRYWQVETASRSPFRSRSLWDSIIDVKEPDQSDYAPFQLAHGPDDKPILVFSEKSTLGDGKNETAFVVRTAFAKSEFDEALRQFHQTLRGMLILVAALLSAAAILQSVIGLMPLVRLRSLVALVRSGTISRLENVGVTEVRPLIGELNLLLDERETAIERARQRASDLAHGLKTPLTVIAQCSRELSPASREIVLKQVELVRQRADRQLQAARLGVERMASTDLGVLVNKLVQVLRPLTDERALDWHLSLPPDLTVKGDPADLAEAIGNVLDNATKWATRTIEVKARKADTDIVLTISDDGPGIAEADRKEMMQRGVYKSEDGSGLGLAITSDIVTAYSGSITLSRSRHGGLSVALSFHV